MKLLTLENGKTVDADKHEAEQFSKRAQDVAAAIRVLHKEAKALACEAEDAGWDFSMDFAAGHQQLLEAAEFFETWDATHATEMGVKNT